MILEWVRLGKILEESSGNGLKMKKIDQALHDKFQETFKKGTITTLCKLLGNSRAGDILV